MRRRTLLLALAALLATAVLGACGGGDDDGAAGEDTAAVETQPAETEPAETGEAEAAGDPAAGTEVFASAGCGNCHTLEDAGANGTRAPNLDERVPQIDEQRIIDQVTNGGQNMPPFGDQLDEQQIRDLAAYLVDATS
jgi:mono/diheme cytochrome c family protein